MQIFLIYFLAPPLHTYTRAHTAHALQQLNVIMDLQGIVDKTVNPKGSNVLASAAVTMFQTQGSLEGHTAYPM
jgi:hypothetical protein